MPRLMSVAYTEQAVRARTKTVTRRLGWRMLKRGDTLTLCAKVQGRKKGEPLDRICDVEIIRVGREPLWFIDEWPNRLSVGGITTAYVLPDEVVLEGFPDMHPVEFVDFFCKQMRCTPLTVVTRIEWRYLDSDTNA